MSPMMQMLSPFSGIGLLSWMLGVLTASAGASTVSKEVASSVALDPDETSFAFTRCIELYTSGNGSQGDVRAERIRNWTRWQFEESASDQQTSCFVRDLLFRLELLDVGAGHFRVEQLLAQYEQYKEFVNCTDDEVNKLVDDLERYTDLRDCDSVFHAFRESILSSVDVFRKLFLLHPFSASAVYSHLGSSIRRPKQSVFEYCENKFYNTKLDIWCAARNYSIPDDQDFHKHMDCIFKGLRYFNRREDLDVDEICRDFQQIGITHLNESISKTLRSCDVNPDTKALSYYRCLLKSDFLDQFKEALDYREVRSSDYFYALRDPMPVYDRNQVQGLINSLNREYCSNS